MLNPFRKITTLDRINNQITLTEESLIVNMQNAEHFAANAEGNRKQLIKLRAMKSAGTAEPTVAIAKRTGPRLATSK